MRVDKTLAYLWDLRQSDDDVVVETVEMAINTIKRQQEEIDRLSRKITWWEGTAEEHLEEIKRLKVWYHSYQKEAKVSQKLRDLLSQITKGLEDSP